MTNVKDRLVHFLATVPQGHFVYAYPPHKIYSKIEGEFDFKKSWASTPAGDLNVYFHIPFCRQKCSYCNIESIATKEGSPMTDRYLTALENEMRLYRGSLDKFRIITVYMGGGTPSYLSEPQMERFFKSINSLLVNTKSLEELCIELSPDSTTEKKIEILKGHGVTRISLGVQSFDESHIQTFNRKYNVENLDYLLELIKANGFKNLNIDIIYGHPNQDIKMLEESLIRSLASRPGTISMYPLNVKPLTPFWKKIGPEGLDRNKIDNMYEFARDFLLRNGYKQDTRLRFVLPSIGRYAHKDETVKGKPVKGFGNAAQSYAEDVHYRPSYSVSHCKKDIEEYITDIESGRHPARYALFLNKDEKMRRAIIMNLRHSSLSLFGFRKKFEITPQNAFPEEFGVLLEEGMIFEDNGIIKLTERGYKHENAVSKLFFSETILELQRNYKYE